MGKLAQTLIVGGMVLIFTGVGVCLNWASKKRQRELDAMTPEERAEHDNDRAW